jgi:hypothetical protein
VKNLNSNGLMRADRSMPDIRSQNPLTDISWFFIILFQKCALFVQINNIIGGVGGLCKRNTRIVILIQTSFFFLFLFSFVEVGSTY